MNGKVSGGGGGRRNPCLTMHQPWASLLVHGIKRIEGRSWPAPLTGRLWIHAASKVPEPDTIKAMENFYREIYNVDGISNIKFPKQYPVSRLLGCVEITGCLKREELVCWEKIPQSVRLEGLTDFCWLCENPQKLAIPIEMRGFQGVYNLENKIYESAIRGLSRIQGPLPVKFHLPGPHDSLPLSRTKPTEAEKSKNVSAAIAGARAAATQFSRRDESRTAIRDQTVVFQKHGTVDNRETLASVRLNRMPYNLGNLRIGEENQALHIAGKQMHAGIGDRSIQQSETRTLVPRGTAKLFSEALKGMNTNRG